MSEEPRAESPDKPIDDDAWRTELAEALAGSSPWRLSHLLYLIMGIAFLLWLIVTFENAVIPLIIIMGIALVVGAGVILARGRSSQQDSLLWMLAIAAEHQMPLATTVAAFADQYSGRYRRRVMRVAALLDSGASLPEALERTPRRGVADALLLIYVGQESGKLAPALRTAAAIRAARAPIWTAISTRSAYILGLLLVVQAIVGFVMYFIIPKFEAIFMDFGVELPPVTIAVIKASHLLVTYFFWFPLLNLFMLVFVPFALSGRSNFEIPFFERGFTAFLGLFVAPFFLVALLSPWLPYWLLLLPPFMFAAWLISRLPLYDRLFERQHTALILRSLALSIDGGRKLEAGLNTLARHYPTKWVRKKLVAAANETTQGVDSREALIRRGLLSRTDHEVASSAASVGNLSWALNELAESSERRFGIRAQAVIQTVFPLVICAIGAMILTVAVAFFAPLVELIWEAVGMIARKRVGRSRRGSLLAETAMSAVMLIIAMSLIARVVGWTAADRRNLDRRQWAVQEAANVMERLGGRPFDALTTDALKNTALSPEAAGTLPDAQLDIEVADHDPTGGDDSKRITLGLRWRSRSGEWDAPVRLTSWVYRRKEGSR